MIEIISTSFYDNFMSLCAKSQSCIKICSPYIKTDVFTDLLEVKRSGVSVDLITKVNLRDYHKKASDLDVLRLALYNGGIVYNCSNLHAKVYIFDTMRCIITSANLTASGLKRNVECGLITDDNAIVNSVMAFYDGVTANQDVGRITAQSVEEISELLDRIPPAQPVPYPRLDLSVPSDEKLSAISDGLSGWKRNVFLSLDQFDELFTSTEVSIMAQQLQALYPRNNNREAKIRQVLQKLRDLGLIEFSSPGVYKKLWV